MAPDSSITEERWDLSHQEQEEEEALSLCDLPTNLIQDDSNPSRNHYQETETHQEDFNFNSPWGSVSQKSEMCAADDVFFQGQILPLRHSVSSEPGLIRKFRNDIISLNQSRSDFMDWNSVNGFESFSSRSSSSNCSRSSTSHFSSTTTATRVSNPRSNSIPKNQFQYSNHPSPKPQIRLSSASLGSSGSSNRNRNSSVWEFFRVGLVRTPGIELQDIKARISVSRNSSSSSSNSNSNFKNSIKQNQERQSRKKAGLLLSGCSCSVNALKQIPSDNFIVKSRKSTTNDGELDGLMKNKKKRVTVAKKQSTKQPQQRQGGGKGKEKHATSRHRTFEWIKELSHSHVDDEG